MKFYIYHSYSDKLFSIIGHNTTNRKYDINDRTNEGSVKCKYKSTNIEFIFTKNTNNLDGFHIILVDIARRYDTHFTFTSEISNIYNESGFPKCFGKEIDWFLDNLNFDKKWILLYSMGENLFINSSPNQYRKLNELASKVQFFSDNPIISGNNELLNPINFKNCLSNDVFIWNFLAKIRWAYEFKDIFDNLNKPYKIGFSVRNPKLLRFELLNELSNLNNNDIFLNQTDYLKSNNSKYIQLKDGSTIDYFKEISDLKNININKVKETNIDFDNLLLVENNQNSMEFDYLFRVMSKADIQILDETHSYCDNPSIPMNITEKTYLLIMSNIPFIPTNIYPLDVIENLISNIRYPFYDEIKNISGDASKISNYVIHVLDNYGEYHFKLKKWITEVNSVLVDVVKNRNSMIEQIIKIKE